jgi:hypothetical protein
MNEAAIPDFMHLVSFGHEHESIPHATQAVDVSLYLSRMLLHYLMIVKPI